METIHRPRGSSTRPILYSRSWTGGRRKRTKRQIIFFTPLDPFNSDADEAEIITGIKKPRKLNYQIHWRHEQDSVCWIHLSKAQDVGPDFWQTGSNAIMSVPKELRRKGCQRKWKERIVRQTTYLRKRTKSNTQSLMGSCEIQQIARASGNREQVADVEP